jgi:pSer/pThr/pTyr-binding forkhead associated (FHA) protein
VPILVVERGNDKGKSLKLEPGQSYVFGRDPGSSALPLTDTLTSRRHFQIRTEGKTATIRDLSSTN